MAGTCRSARDRQVEQPMTFHMAWWVVALFILSSIGGSIAMWFAMPELLADANGDPLGILGAVAILAAFLVLLIVPEAYLVIRRLLGIPLLTIDGRGILAGGSWDRDLGIEWHNVREVRVRTTSSNGIKDHYLIVHPKDPDPIRQRAMLLRQKAVLAMNRLMFGSLIGISTVYLGGGWKAVSEALRRHYAGPILLDG
jgi:hypothetical protein